jgi:hypothetical protein
VPGSCKSLWSGVKASKDINISNLHNTLFKDDQEIKKENIADVFATHFDMKLRSIVTLAKIDNQVHDGTKKVTASSFKQDICGQGIYHGMCEINQSKNSEGFNRTP